MRAKEYSGVLCVGCGRLPEGDVNVDAFPHVHGQYCEDYNPKMFKNFVQADALHLPFPDKVFSKVVARHVLEHLDSPLSGLREWNRVCTGQVYVYIPSQWVKDLSEEHLYAWDVNTFRNLMLKVFSHVDVHFTSRIYEFTEKYNIKNFIVNFMSKFFGFYTEIEGIGSNNTRMPPRPPKS